MKETNNKAVKTIKEFVKENKSELAYLTIGMLFGLTIKQQPPTIERRYFIFDSEALEDTKENK